MDDKYLRVSQVAARFGVTPRRLRQLLDEHKIETVRIHERLMLVPIEGVQQLEAIRAEGISRGGWPKGKPRKIRKPP